jgi:uncharacterized damage-inducible protein DinB
MRIVMGLAIVGLAVAPALAQTANPVVSSAQEIYDRQSKFIVAAAEQMPADKYSFKPTADQWTYAKIISHVAAANGGVCAMLSDKTAPATVKVADTAPKEQQIVALKASFDFCDAAMAGLKDAQLGDTITFFGGAKKPRARALVEVVGDLEDHYSQMASYLRLNGMVPPSVKPKK